MSEIEGEAREPNGSSVGPWTGADSAAHLADYEGTNISVTISTGGTQVGGGGSSSGGIARWTVRIESEAGYSGPSTLDIDLRAQVVVNGDVMLSNPSTGGDTCQSELSIVPAAGGLATILLTSSGALTAGSPSYPVETTSVEVDTDYVVQVVPFAQVSASGNPGQMGGPIGTASSWGTIEQSFGIGVNAASSDPLLSVKLPVEDEPGGYAPYPGSAPLFPVPAPAARRRMGRHAGSGDLWRRASHPAARLERVMISPPPRLPPSITRQ